MSDGCPAPSDMLIALRQRFQGQGIRGHAVKAANQGAARAALEAQVTEVATSHGAKFHGIDAVVKALIHRPSMVVSNGASKVVRSEETHMSTTQQGTTAAGPLSHQNRILLMELVHEDDVQRMAQLLTHLDQLRLQRPPVSTPVQPFDREKTSRRGPSRSDDKGLTLSVRHDGKR